MGKTWRWQCRRLKVMSIGIIFKAMRPDEFTGEVFIAKKRNKEALCPLISKTGNIRDPEKDLRRSNKGNTK